ncbi:MAG: SRPBCC family protein [Gemmatimonadaceae bacterium]|nr:SRPBCC family protein [Gemmatimonadaceae bacterium]
MIKQLLLVIFAIVVIVAVAAFMRPDSYRVERAITINAPPERVFPLINDFDNFAVWSPWEKLDPEMERQISPVSSGKGAIYEWRGNSKAGAGRMEILESTPSSRILVKLDFLKPFESHNSSEYTLQPKGDSTTVTWAMYGPSPFASKVMQVFMTMDQMIGKDFERGLASMKRG